MERILRGIMRYRHTTREQMVKEFQKVRDNPQVSEITSYDTETNPKHPTNYHQKFKKKIVHVFVISNFQIIHEMSCSPYIIRLFSPNDLLRCVRQR